MGNVGSPLACGRQIFARRVNRTEDKLQLGFLQQAAGILDAPGG